MALRFAPLDRADVRVDDAFDRFLRGRAPIDRVMYTLSELADFSLLWHLVGATRALASDRHLAEGIRLSVLLGIESTLVNGGLKAVTRRERPVPAFERPLHLRIPLTTSFPSGHASAAFCAAGLLSEGRRTGWFWYPLATAVAASRIHVKIHHASDVVGGALVGATLAAVTKRIWPRPR